ncbi:hypothetical protein [Paenibacillus glycanilyticus]|uniref:hypothetical protein n=1 Tax=Paenibacillus glycanilyticus TaxID=126569 RepID=UPI0019103B1D|nr:hypothetical protein [Paenibacillus glycanilyticus]
MPNRLYDAFQAFRTQDAVTGFSLTDRAFFFRLLPVVCPASVMQVGARQSAWYNSRMMFFKY